MMHQKVLHFWFEEIDSSYWWKKDEQFDASIKDKFETTLNQARQGELFTWRASAEGRLAEIIVLDQFSRNIYRDTPESFSQDPQALCLAQEAISLGIDKNLDTNQRVFLYMPYMHSESKLIHEEAIRLFEELGNKNNLDFEHKHKVIIDQFGRYPHRNKTLGRESTPEELEFLKKPGSGF